MGPNPIGGTIFIPAIIIKVMGKTVNVPGRLLALVGIGIMVLVVSMLLLPKVQVKPTDPTCPPLSSLVSRFDTNTSSILLKNENNSYPQVGQFTIKPYLAVRGKEERLACRSGSKAGENVNNTYCENLQIAGLLVDNQGNIIKEVKRKATLVVDKNGKFIRSFCP